MSLVHRAAVPVRRALVARPWLYWVMAVGLALAAAASVQAHQQRLTRARADWGTAVTVLVATRSIGPGDALGDRVTTREIPRAMVPGGALEAHELTEAAPAGQIARQRIGVGEIVTRLDVTGAGPLALVPEGWLAVPLVESPRSGAAPGDRVEVAGDGLVLAPDALVVGAVDTATLVAVPAELAALLPQAAEDGSVTLLRVP